MSSGSGRLIIEDDWFRLGCFLGEKSLFFLGE
jgi:hypothetical protein